MYNSLFGKNVSATIEFGDQVTYQEGIVMNRSILLSSQTYSLY